MTGPVGAPIDGGDWLQASLKQSAARSAAECRHKNLPPVPFDADACKGKPAQWVRQNYPRLHQVCPDCKAGVICYASSEHYYAGDY